MSKAVLFLLLPEPRKDSINPVPSIILCGIANELWRTIHIK